MANPVEIALLYQEQIRQEIRDKQNYGRDLEHNRQTTSTVNHSVDPLRNLQILDALLVTPTDTPSKDIVIQAGNFYCRGALYTYPGKQVSIPQTETNPENPIYIYIGLNVTKTEIKEYIHPFYYEQEPVLPPNIFPLALICYKGNEIFSYDIKDLRPYWNFDLTFPPDRNINYIPWFEKNTSTVIDRRPLFHDKAPLVAVYTKSKPEPIQIVHKFHNATSFMGLKDYKYQPTYDPSNEGATINYNYKMFPINYIDDGKTVYVSIEEGSYNGTGTINSPYISLEQAIHHVNSLPIFKTIFIKRGQYILNTELTVKTPITIIGESPHIVKLIVTHNHNIIKSEFDLTIKTVGLDLRPLPGGNPNTTYIETTDNMIVKNTLIELAYCDRNIPSLFRATASLFITNCVFNNKYTPNPNSIYTSSIYSWSPNTTIQNSIQIGAWEEQLLASNACINSTTDPVISNDEYYRPLAGSPCIDKGIWEGAGTDKDGTMTDIGLYGGEDAAEAMEKIFPTGMPFPVIHVVDDIKPRAFSKITDIEVEAVIPESTYIRALVRINKHHELCTWDETKDNWIPVGVDWERALTPHQLKERLQSINTLNGNITSLQIVWLLLSSSSVEARPVLQKVTITGLTTENGLINLNLDDFTFLHLEDGTSYVTNNSGLDLEEVIFVAY